MTSAHRAHLLRAAMAGVIGMMANFNNASLAHPGNTKTGRYRSRRADHGPGKKLARRIRSMAR